MHPPSTKVYFNTYAPLTVWRFKFKIHVNSTF